jgi:hypothetical protein
MEPACPVAFAQWKTGPKCAAFMSWIETHSRHQRVLPQSREDGIIERPSFQY